MNKKILGLVIGLMVFMVALPAFAAGAGVLGVASATAMSRVLDFVLTFGETVGIPLAVWFVHRLVKAFENKTGVKVPGAALDELDHILEHGVAYAEQKAAVALKNAGEKMKGPEKLELAANFVLDLAEQYKLPDMARDKVEKLLEAKLGLSLPEKAVNG